MTVTYLNAPSSSDLASAEAAAEANTIEKVRELLYGEAMRSQGRRVEDLREALNDIEQRMVQRLNDMQKSMDTLALSLRMEQGNAVRAIGGAITEMGRQISAMGEMRDRTP